MAVHHHLRISGIIMLALLGTASILSVLVAATNFLTVQSIRASDLLPAQDTIFFAQYPTKELLDRFATWFPELSLIQFEAHTEALALTASGYALFIRETRETLNENMLSLPPFTVLVSDPSIKDLLRTDQKTLSASSLFQQSKNPSAKTPWTYIRSSALSKTLPFLQDTSIEALSISGDSASQQITLVGSKALRTSAIQKRISIFLPKPFFVFSGRDISQYWDMVQSRIPSNAAQVSHAIFLEAIQDAYGNDISWKYDIAPLLGTQTTMELAYNESGTLLFALHGTAPLGHNTEESLQKISASFMHRFPDTIEVRVRTLDNRFNARDIRMNTNPTFSKVAETNGWITQRIAASQTQSMLLTARKGRSFIISNADSVWNTLQTTTPKKTMILPNAKNIQQPEIVAGGFVESRQLTSFLQNQVPELQIIVRTLLQSIQNERFAWSLGLRGPLCSVQIQRQEEGEFPWQIQDPTVE